MRRTSVITLRTVAAAVAAVGLVPVSPAAQAVGETCRGLPATIVGTPDQPVLGTSGPDVVVSAGASSVDTGDGDDVVCTTGSGQSSSMGVVVATGAGNDVIDSTGETAYYDSHYYPGAGDDTVVGGASTDRVTDDAGHDTISTGGGLDIVYLEGSPSVHQVQVDLGPGLDTANIFSPLGPASVIGGGDGEDTLLGPDGVPSGRWVFDNVHGEARRNGVVQVRWTGMESFQPDYLGVRGRLDFVGGAGEETLVVDHLVLGNVQMGGGDDWVTVSTAALGKGIVLGGGTGRDFAAVLPEGSDGRSPVTDLTVDLSRDLLGYVARNGEASGAALTGFDDAWASAPRVRLSGDRHDNVLRYAACVAVVQGGRGNDLIRFPSYQANRRCAAFGHRGSRVDGGPGDDRMVGGKYADTLVGGPGIDRADGKRGRDRCDAETVANCEVLLP